MSSLICINQSWHREPWLFERLGRASQGDTIVLMEEAVLALQSPLTLGSFLAKCESRSVGVKAMRDDVQTHGIVSAYDSIELIDYARLVELVVQHDKQIAW